MELGPLRDILIAIIIAVLILFLIFFIFGDRIAGFLGFLKNVIP